MAFGRLERTAAPQPMSDINITPLVDVMLVLVVIFLLTAPLLASAIRLDLPRAGGSTPLVTRDRRMCARIRASASAGSRRRSAARMPWCSRRAFGRSRGVLPTARCRPRWS